MCYLLWISVRIAQIGCKKLIFDGRRSRWNTSPKWEKTSKSHQFGLYNWRSTKSTLPWNWWDSQMVWNGFPTWKVNICKHLLNRNNMLLILDYIKIVWQLETTNSIWFDFSMTRILFLNFFLSLFICVCFETTQFVYHHQKCICKAVRKSIKLDFNSNHHSSDYLFVADKTLFHINMRAGHFISNTYPRHLWQLFTTHWNFSQGASHSQWNWIGTEIMHWMDNRKLPECMQSNVTMCYTPMDLSRWKNCQFAMGIVGEEWRHCYSARTNSTRTVHGSFGQN